MASMWEILDPSNLRYDTTLGLTQEDSGSGPPEIQFGWVRTGRYASTLPFEGAGNCGAWTSNNSEDHGTAVMLRGIWQGPGTSPIEPWSAAAGSCNTQVMVWCVQD
jgi:hypothetical protein